MGAHRQRSDPVAARSPALCRFFARYMRRFLQRNFHAIRIARSGQPRLPPERPAIVYTNHPSWWDPALLIVLANTLFAGRPAYGPMDRKGLEKYRFMERIGIFGVEPGTLRGAAAFRSTGLRILEDPHAMLWVTAEGSFTDPRVRPLRLQPGVAHLMSQARHAVAVPLALEYPFWDERYPEALCRFGEPLPGAAAGSVEDWRRLLEERLTVAMDQLAADAMTRDPGQFEVLLEGAVGIGGVYDAYRHLRARLAGRRFHAGHGEPGR
ncbi:MAG: putative phospholipid/glycerol acyltransferase [Geminicoccaceae bacterium]|jgi:1-acyl-sn-glycerol-3-phosphate acyltransferase|nr:putative phospholipid/glycerol acyltransferase [Geminicoccaceae bacterium]MCE3246700.1 putative phospholipid/glycerol acyltransferase [Geminicoccaceae bacterium]MDF2781692.1 putative phospholipid/glycerol acyltransferase [Geminicoccaceae bacterium]